MHKAWWWIMKWIFKTSKGGFSLLRAKSFNLKSKTDLSLWNKSGCKVSTKGCQLGFKSQEPGTKPQFQTCKPDTLPTLVITTKIILLSLLLVPPTLWCIFKASSTPCTCTRWLWYPPCLLGSIFNLFLQLSLKPLVYHAKSRKGDCERNQAR